VSENSDKGLSLSSLRVPQYKYFPTHLLEKRGPKQWARLRILQACDRLGIPRQVWPKFRFPELPRTNIAVRHVQPDFELPPFLPLQETPAEWKSRCQKAFDQFFETEADPIVAEFQQQVKSGMYTKIISKRDTTPLDLRYEWTAKRLCYRLRFSEIVKESPKGYTEHRIREAVNAIIREAGLRQDK